MSEHEPTPKKTVRKLNYSRIIPLVLGLCILVIAIIGVIRLIQWNRGVEYIVDPDVDVESEPEDLVFFMDPSTLPDSNYDGQLTILALGNDTLAYDKGGINIAERLAAETNATVYNCAFSGSFMATQGYTAEDIEKYPLDAFSFFWISDSIQTGNWKHQEEALENLPEHVDAQAYRETLELAQSIDYNDIDLLIIYYDGHDYLNEHPIANPVNMYDVHTMEGSFTGCFERYPVNYPNMQFMMIAPTFCYVTAENGTKTGCDIANLGHGNLPTCLTTLQIQAENYGVSYVDNFYGISINAETADQYLMDDGITPNEEGREMIVKRIAGFITPRLFNQ